MKKLKICTRCATFAIALFVIAAMSYLGISRAEESGLTGNGNFVYKSGEQEAAFYAEDINYLQREITTLFQEMEENDNE